MPLVEPFQARLTDARGSKAVPLTSIHRPASADDGALIAGPVAARAADGSNSAAIRSTIGIETTRPDRVGGGGVRRMTNL
jgi:hypothetical protein